MKWILIKQLRNQQSVSDFERQYDITFPDSYVSIVKENNYGRPRPNVFDTAETNERVAKALLSFDATHRENMWDTITALSKELPANTYPFMIDQFGNYICFYFTPVVEEPTIIFFDLEEQNIEMVADSFEEFLKFFYELP